MIKYRSTFRFQAILLKNNIIGIRLDLWRNREIVVELSQDEFKVISEQAIKYLHSVDKHTEVMIGVVEAQIESAKTVFDLYSSYSSRQTNDTLEILTYMSLYVLPATLVRV